MKANVGDTDAVIRGVLAAVLFVLSLTLTSMLWSFLVAGIALVLAATAVTRRCPLYVVLGIDTRPGHPVAH